MGWWGLCRRESIPGDSWFPKTAAESENAGSRSACVEGGFEKPVCDPDGEERGKEVGLVQRPRPPPSCLQLGPPEPLSPHSCQSVELTPQSSCSNTVTRVRNSSSSSSPRGPTPGSKCGDLPSACLEPSNTGLEIVIRADIH